METRRECYEVGALLYCPASNKGVADSVISGKFGNRYSLALCLEDTIAEERLQEAEENLLTILAKLKNSGNEIHIPRIFIRVRNPEHLKKINIITKDYKELISGFIFPKYSINNADKYNAIMREINESSKRIIYMLPILESKDIVEYSTRYEVLTEIKKKMDSVHEIVLNVRVGGNDFCNEFSVRRHYDETIYDILPISNLLADILTVFSRDYVVSGPVWEFFSSDNNEWKTGLQRETKLDVLNGFVGKTVIHPKQISVVNESLRVSQKDYEDAKAIMAWKDDEILLVGKSSGGERMNEKKTHENWAQKTIILAEEYGIC